MSEVVVEEKQPKWIKTRVQHLYRHRDSGRYYVRGFRQGKEIWKALKTTSAEIARAQAPRVLQEINKQRILSESLLSGKPTVGEAADLYRAKVRDRRCDQGIFKGIQIRDDSNSLPILAWIRRDSTFFCD